MKFEYLVEPVMLKSLPAHLNRRGAEGWELIHANRDAMIPSTDLIFKRAIAEPMLQAPAYSVPVSQVAARGKNAPRNKKA